MSAEYLSGPADPIGRQGFGIWELDLGRKFGTWEQWEFQLRKGWNGGIGLVMKVPNVQFLGFYLMYLGFL